MGCLFLGGGGGWGLGGGWGGWDVSVRCTCTHLDATQHDVSCTGTHLGAMQHGDEKKNLGRSGRNSRDIQPWNYLRAFVHQWNTEEKKLPMTMTS